MPEFQNINDVIRQFLQLRAERMPEAELPERENLKNIYARLKAARSQSRKISPDELARIEKQVIGSEEKSALTHIFEVIDMGRNLIAKEILVPILGLKQQLGNKDTVTSSDILGGLGMEEGWMRTALGFAGDIATDPITYFMPYTKMARGIGIATKTGEKVLTRQGGEALKNLFKDALKERYGAENITEKLAQTVGKSQFEIGKEIKDIATERLVSLLDDTGKKFKLNTGEIEAFVEPGGYLHIPFTNIFKKVYGTKVPNEIARNIANFPTIRELVPVIDYAMSSLLQPVTVGAMRAVGSLREKAKYVAQLAYGDRAAEAIVYEAMSEIGEKSVMGIKYKGRVPIFKKTEHTMNAMRAWEEMGAAVSRFTGKEVLSWDDYFSFIKRSDEFKGIAAKYGIPEDDMLKYFKSQQKLGQKFSDEMIKAGLSSDEFLDFYVPHKLRSAWALFDKHPTTGQPAARTFNFKRDFGTMEHGEQFFSEKGVSKWLHYEQNPYQAWSDLFKSLYRAKSQKEYLESLMKGGIIKQHLAVESMDAIKVASKLYPKEFGQLALDGIKPVAKPIDKIALKQNAIELLKNKINSGDDALLEFARQHFDETGKPVALNLGDGIRVIDERGRMGKLNFETLGDANRAIQGTGEAEHVSGLFLGKDVNGIKRAFIKKDINGIVYEGLVSDIKDLDDVLRVKVPNPLLGAAAQAWNKVTGWFKYWATVGGGQYVFMSRNLMGDQLRTLYDSSLNALNPINQRDAITIMTNYDPIQRGFVKLSKMHITTDIGDKISGEQIARWADEFGLISHQIEKFDTAKYYNKISQEKGLPGYRHVREYFNFLNRTNVGVENHTKMVNFIADLKSGMTPEQAATRTHEFLYNYKLLPKAVQKSLGAVPFGRWTYHNTLGMVKRFVDEPGKQMALIRGMGGLEQAIPQVMGVEPLTEKERKSLPRSYQEDVIIPLYRHASGAMGILHSFDIPLGELNEYGLFNGITRTLKKVVGGRLHPVLKGLIEQVMNEDLFFETPLEGSITTEEGETLYPINPTNPMYGWPVIKQLVGGRLTQSKTGEQRWEGDVNKVKWLETLTAGIPARPMSEYKRYKEQPLLSSALRTVTGFKIDDRNIYDFQRRNFSKIAEQLNELIMRQRKWSERGVKKQ